MRQAPVSSPRCEAPPRWSGDMFTKLRQVIIAGYLRTVDPEPPPDQAISILRLAWQDVAA